MTLLAYTDIRPILFLAGLPLFIGLAVLVCSITGAKFQKRKVALFSSLLFVGLFTFFLTGAGPFVDQKETREYWMTWEIKPGPSQGMKESEVVLSFVDFPGHYIGIYSDQLAAHLPTLVSKKVKVVFEITSDYGKVRGFKETEIAGLKNWSSEWGYAGSIGTPSKSPWD
jgi:hypothetical protein